MSFPFEPGYLLAVTATNSSFSRFSPGLQLAVDSTSLGAYKICPRWYYYTIVLGRVPRAESVHLTFGLLMHQGREIYYHLRAKGTQHSEALLDTLASMLETTLDTTTGRPWASDHPAKNRLSLLRALVWYLDLFGENDPLETVILASGKPAVELSFQFDPGFRSDEGEPWLLCGHLDRLAKLNGEPYIDDLKTSLYALSPSWFDKFTPGNQFSLYCVAGQIVWKQPTHGLIVNGCQVGATFARFQRGLVPRPQAVLDEWLEATGEWLRQMQADAKAGARLESAGSDPAEAWKMNDTSCDRFGGCPARGICSRSPASRGQALELDFKQRVWDPLQRREDI